MNNIEFILDSPTYYKQPYKFYSQGNSPTITNRFLKYLEDNQNNIESVLGSLYLFNNKYLSDGLRNLSDKGININIFSIPLEGYDDDKEHAKHILDIKTFELKYSDKKTKLQLAEEVYAEFISKESDNYKLYIFPHMCIRSHKVKPFSRGAMPYSLHIKSFYIKFKNGGGAVALTSSNLAVRDLIKDEVMIIVENNVSSNEAAEEYFNELAKNAVAYKNFIWNNSFYQYQISPIISKYGELSINNKNLYISPFFEDSADNSEKEIMKLISTAERRIYICAQHISAFNYRKANTINKSTTVYNPSLLSTILQKGKGGIAVKCLSQTFVDDKGNSYKCRRPANTNSFKEFIKEFKKLKSGNYYANESVHCKFIIVDDLLIVSTCNFTPTQFIYNKHINIERFENIEDLSYKGIHCEVGQYMLINDKIVCEKFVEFFNEICTRTNTFHFEPKLITEKCDKCGRDMITKNGRYGKFLSCSGFPSCRNSKSL